MGLHFDHKSKAGERAMEKERKRLEKLAEKKAKRLAKEGPKEEEVKEKSIDTSQPLSLEAITNPNKE